MMQQRPTAVASTRLSPVEKELLEASAARAGARFVSRHLRRVVQEHLRQEFGDHVIGNGEEDAGE